LSYNIFFFLLSWVQQGGEIHKFTKMVHVIFSGRDINSCLTYRLVIWYFWYSWWECFVI